MKLTRWKVAVLALIAALVTIAGVPVAHAQDMGGLLTFGLAGIVATGTDDTQEIMKVIFSEPLVMNVVTDSELMGEFESDTNVQEEKTTGGRYIEAAHYFALSGGVGAIVERGTMPQADPPVFGNSRVYLKQTGGSVELTGDEMKKVKAGPGGWVDYAERALPDLVTRVVNTMDRQYIGYGYGVKARVTSVSAYNSPAAGQFDVVVEDTLGIDGWTDPWLQFLEQERDVFTASLTNPITVRNAGTGQSALLKNIDPDTNTLTFAGLEALRDLIQAGDYVGDGDRGRYSFPHAGVTVELSGLLAAVDNGDIVSTYMNIARATNRMWQGQVINAMAAPFDGTLTESLLNYADRRARKNGGGKVDLIVTSDSGADSYWESLKGDRMFQGSGSYVGGRPNGLPIVLGDRTIRLKVARKLPPQITFGLQTDTFKRFSLGSWEWDDTTGSIWNRVVDTTGFYNMFAAFGYMYEELFCSKPAKNFRIDGTIPSP